MNENSTMCMSYVLSASRDKRVKVWEITTGKQMGTLMQAPSGDPNWTMIPTSLSPTEGQIETEEATGKSEMKNRNKNRDIDTIGIVTAPIKLEELPKSFSKSLQSSTSNEKVGFLFPIEAKLSSIPAIQSLAPISILFPLDLIFYLTFKTEKLQSTTSVV